MSDSPTVTLSHRDLGGKGNPPLIILHGLLGSSRNWVTVGTELGDEFHVQALDLRNHGESGHAPEHTYDAMARDVLAWLDEAGLEQIHLMGHSMGGKVAMRLACLFPARVTSLVVVDIGPWVKKPHADGEIAALQSLPLAELSSRAEADKMLAVQVPSLGTRQFFLTNLVRSEEGGFGWQSNLPVLAKELDRTGDSPIGEEDSYRGPALWIIGGKSDFVSPEDHGKIRSHFPKAIIEVFPESGHNPHAESRVHFVQRVRRFLVDGW